MTIYMYKIAIKNRKQEEVTIKKYYVVGENEEYFCINDSRFSTFAKNKTGSIEMHLEHVSITDWGKLFLGKYDVGRFTITLYTETESKKIAENKINKEFQKFIRKSVEAYLFDDNFKIEIKL